MGPQDRCSGRTWPSRRFQEHSKNLQDASPHIVPRGFKTATRALQEASRWVLPCSNGLWWARETRENWGRSHLGPQSRCSGPPLPSRGLQARFKRLQDAPPQIFPRLFKTAPRALQEAPGWVQDGSRGFETAPRAFQEASRRPRKRSKRRQDGPSAFQEAARGPQ